MRERITASTFSGDWRCYLPRVCSGGTGCSLYGFFYGCEFSHLYVSSAFGFSLHKPIFYTKKDENYKFSFKIYSFRLLSTTFTLTEPFNNMLNLIKIDGINHNKISRLYVLPYFFCFANLNKFY